MSNANLNKAAKAKNDEFYTLYEDIEKELSHYTSELEGKIIYCPCDDYRWSNFPKYFKDKFKELGLKEVISTNYDLGDGAWKWTYDGNSERIEKLTGNGDYRSSECSALRDYADVIITNPPFSKFIDFYAWIREIERKFLILGNPNGILTHSLFKDFFEGKLNWGFKRWGGMWFFDKNSNTNTHINATWLQNFKPRPSKPLSLTASYYKDPGKYEFLDSGFLNINKTSEIPSDYYEPMAVPISFLDKYCPSQFELLGKLYRDSMKPLPSEYDFGKPRINGKKLFIRILIKRK